MGSLGKLMEYICFTIRLTLLIPNGISDHNNRINSLRQICTIIRAISLPNKGIFDHCITSQRDQIFH